jgi:photosystem II stability/assembly factor-like uncharacterized protein
MSTTNGGITWSFPFGTTVSRSWTGKLALPAGASMRGSTFALNPADPNAIYYARTDTVYRSRDEGETWEGFAAIPECSGIGAFIVSPKDSNVFVAAIDGDSGMRVVRSADHGQSWSTTLGHDFGSYATPLECDPDRPDTLYFGGVDDSLHRSTDGGQTWSALSGNVFRSPSDIVVIPDSGSVILVADGVPAQGQAQIFKSTDGGQTFTLEVERPLGVSYVPRMSSSRLRNGTVFATNWGGGGVLRTTDYGESWPPVAPTTTAWGTDIAGDDPNVAIYGIDSGEESYLSLDGGASFSPIDLPGSNHAFLARDRGLVLADQSDGIYKLGFAYDYTPQSGQSLAVMAPNGGELWDAGTPHDITWSAVHVALARIEYRRDPTAPWQLVAEVPGYYGAHQWTVPNDPTTQAKVRVTDAWDGSPEDSSDAAFTIHVEGVSVGGPSATAFALLQNRPNPFTRSTRIDFALPAESDVTLDVFDLQGQRVARLVSGRRSAGFHSVSVDPRSDARGRLAAGVYFYRLRAGTFVDTRKMLVLQ